MTSKNSALDIVIAVLAYFILQFVCAFGIIGGYFGYLILTGNSVPAGGYMELMGEMMGPIMCVSDILTVLLIILLIKRINLIDEFSWNECKWKYVVPVILISFISIFACNFIEELINLPNLVEAQLTDMSGSLWGVMAIAVLGPVTEEIIFRGVACGGLLRAGVKPWTAIIVSALLFGLIHMNPAQIPFAMILGIIFAIIYYKTKSLIPSTILHILNNSFAVISMNCIDNQDEMSFENILGTGMFYVMMIVCSVIGIVSFTFYWKKR